MGKNLLNKPITGHQNLKVAFSYWSSCIFSIHRSWWATVRLQNPTPPYPVIHRTWVVQLNHPNDDDDGDGKDLHGWLPSAATRYEDYARSLFQCLTSQVSSHSIRSLSRVKILFCMTRSRWSTAPPVGVRCVWPNHATQMGWEVSAEENVNFLMDQDFPRWCWNGEWMNLRRRRRRQVMVGSISIHGQKWKVASCGWAADLCARFNFQIFIFTSRNHAQLCSTRCEEDGSHHLSTLPPPACYHPSVFRSDQVRTSNGERGRWWDAIRIELARTGECRDGACGRTKLRTEAIKIAERK